MTTCVQSQYRQARGNLHHGFSLAVCCIRLSESSKVHTVLGKYRHSFNNDISKIGQRVFVTKNTRKIALVSVVSVE